MTFQLYRNMIPSENNKRKGKEFAEHPTVSAAHKWSICVNAKNSDQDQNRPI